MQANQEGIPHKPAAGNPNMAKGLESDAAFRKSMKEYSRLTDQPFLKMRASE